MADEGMRAALQQLTRKHAIYRDKGIHLEGKGSESLGAWFLGPQGENRALLKQLVMLVIDDHVRDRRRLKEPKWLTRRRRSSAAYRESARKLKEELEHLVTVLDGSVPFFSYRYQAHMLWDSTLPAVVGYFAAMLYNQNNVAVEASPVTSRLETIVGEDLCRMLGYDPRSAWGHITCDGSVANIEAMWAARNLKYYPAGVAAALAHEEELAPARDVRVTLPTGEGMRLRELDSWQLLNLSVDEALDLPERIAACFERRPDTDRLLKKYSLQQLGLLEFGRRWLPDVADPVVLAPATMHYSWPKATALLGMGRARLIPVKVDLDARMDVDDLLDKLYACHRERRPVIMVVAVMGSTAEGAVDPLVEILHTRQQCRACGLEFWIHADAAWGGYFASMLRPPEDSTGQPGRKLDAAEPVHRSSEDTDVLFVGPRVSMSKHVTQQMAALRRADSITVDPHKSGYIPYPAGGLCYRNSAARHLVTFSAPIVFQGEDLAVGIYGVEGSKPGAAAAAVYLSHRVIRTDQSGYGRLLGRCLFNSKRLYSALVTMAKAKDPFRVVTVQRLPQERAQGILSRRELDTHLAEIRKSFVKPVQNRRLLEKLNTKPSLREQFRGLGSDQLILTCAFNFRRGDAWNRSLTALNALNKAIFSEMSVLHADADNAPPTNPMFVTSSELDPATHGKALVTSFLSRLGVAPEPSGKVSVLVLTTMDPWLTDTAKGNLIPWLIHVLRKTVIEIVERGEPFAV